MVTEFSKGDTDSAGDCGKFEAGIHHCPTGMYDETWFQRVVVYGNTPEEAEALRDRLMAGVSNGNFAVNALVEARATILELCRVTKTPIPKATLRRIDIAIKQQDKLPCH